MLDPAVPTGFAGSVDVKTCDGVAGWAADRSRLNQSITVSLWNGATSVFSTPAALNRPDVGAAIGDNGLHGFNFTIPTNLQDGVRRTYTVKYESGTTKIGTEFALTCGTTQPPPPATTAVGYFDYAGCDGLRGWAADLSRLNQSISIELVEGSTVLTTILANGNRPDVGGLLGDNGLHGFSVPLPDSLKTGTSRTIPMRFAGTTTALSNSPRTIQCNSTSNPPPVTANNRGYFDYAGCDAVQGWAVDLNRLNQAISIELVEGSTVLSTILANGSRPDVGSLIGDNGLHGFSAPLPDSLKTGTARTISLRFAGTTTPLTNSPRTIQCGTSSAANYKGYFDNATCDGLQGWAADINRLNQPISVDLVEGSTILTTILANASRGDVGAVIGDNGLHGFTIPIPDSLKNGLSRTLQIRYSGTTTPLNNSPRTIQCSQSGPPPATASDVGYFDGASCSVLQGWAADQSRLNQAISVDVVEGSTVLATVLANASRPDVGAVIGDNGLHGFAIPTPAALKNGTQRTVQLRYSGTSTQLSNSPRTLQCATP